MRLWQKLLGGEEERDNPLDWDAYQNFFNFGGLQYPMLQTTMGTVDEEKIAATANAAYQANGIVFALVMARMQVFSQARFQWTRFVDGHAGDLFGSSELSVLEKPWRGGTTGDLLARMELDASLAGNAYIRRTREDRLNRLRPDWVTVVMGSNENADNPSEAGDVEVLGYAYKPPTGQMVLLEPFQVAHYAPIPDPNSNFLGQSWITPSMTDVQADDASTVHKKAFFTNAAPQPLTARVLTPRGWSTMGAMVIGSEVIGSDGKPHRVTGVFPQGERDIYRVTFGDGSAVECTEDHLWSVQSYYDRRRNVLRTMSLRDMVAGGLQYRSGPSKWAVPFVDPVEFADPGPLSVDPYLLGLLLGDGCFRSNGKGSGGVSLAADLRDAEWLEATLPDLVPDGVTLSRRDRGGGSEFYFRGRGGPRPNPMTGAVRSLGLWDVLGPGKFIPEPYLHGSVSQRVALLRGLLDSDGSVQASQPNSVSFTNKSRALAYGVRELARSLGGTATIVEVPAKDQWLTRVQRLPRWIIPFALPRKVATYEPPADRGVHQRFITDVELVGRELAQCIRVDTPDSLYVTDDYVLTHNTPNLAIKFDPGVTIEKVKQFKELLEAEHRGAWNAWKTLYLGGGADPVVIGKDFKELEFAVTQGKGESRLASAAGVPPSWVGFSEGLQGSALNAGNFTAARRRFGDGTMRHLWANASASLDVIVKRPRNGDGVSLWYSSEGIPFLAEDAKDSAEIQQVEASTITNLVTMGGFTWDSAVKAVQAHDWSLLKHTGLLSVQMQPPGTEAGKSVETVSDPRRVASLLQQGWRLVEPSGDDR